MATINMMKRLIKTSKVMVNLTQGLSEKGGQEELKVAGALTIGALAVTYYYGRRWLLPANAELGEILRGSQDDPMLEDTIEVEMPTSVVDDSRPCKRRVRAGRRQPFMKEVLSCAKNRFGTPANTAANHRVVRRFMLDFMKEHHVRDASIREFMPKLIAAMFVPDKYEMQAMQLANCPLAHARKLEYAMLKHTSGLSAM